MGGHIGVLLHQYLLQNGLHPLLVQLRHQAVEDVGQQHPHTRQQPRPGHGAGILRRKPPRARFQEMQMAPTESHRVPSRSNRSPSNTSIPPVPSHKNDHIRRDAADTNTLILYHTQAALFKPPCPIFLHKSRGRWAAPAWELGYRVRARWRMTAISARFRVPVGLSLPCSLPWITPAWAMAAMAVRA